METNRPPPVCGPGRNFADLVRDLPERDDAPPGIDLPFLVHALGSKGSESFEAVLSFLWLSKDSPESTEPAAIIAWTGRRLMAGATLTPEQEARARKAIADLWDFIPGGTP